MAFVSNRLTAIDDKSQRRKVNLMKVLVPNLEGHHVEGEIRQPRYRRALLGDGFQQQRRSHCPLKGIDLNARDPEDEREVKRSDQPHVVIEGQPTHDFVGVRKGNGLGITFHMFQHSIMRQKDRFLETRRPRRVL
jgi:hypothetical protein